MGYTEFKEEIQMTTNGREQVNVDALRSTVAAVTEDRRLGKVEFTVRGQWDGGLRLESTTGPRQAAADQGQRSGRFTMNSDETERTARF